MLFLSTRGKTDLVCSAHAITRGMADDGGLFVPQKFVAVPLEDIIALHNLSYQERAVKIISLFLTDYSEKELADAAARAYDAAKFGSCPAPVVQVNDNTDALELWHGPTSAFKDMALQILPLLLTKAIAKTGEQHKIVILTATSGDTGKAALEGFADVDGTEIIVFYPESGVSDIQKQQMVTQAGKNVHVFAVKGNFDDAQTGVKQIFANAGLNEEIAAQGCALSSANSINWGRLVPQIVYYFWAYLQAVRMGEIKNGEALNFTVPTGNFGDILAGWYAMKMGLPVGHFVCASNDNKVLYDFFRTGEYNKNRAFHVTVSPSMDILISSNLERLLAHMGGQAATKAEMESLNRDGVYHAEITEKSISGEYATEAETFAAIKDFYEKTGYVMDTHTAVAYAAYQKYKAESGDNTPMVIVSTASPYKFTKDVMTALDAKYKDGDAFALQEDLERISGVAVPAPIVGLEHRPILHKNVCEKTEIKDVVKNWLK